MAGGTTPGTDQAIWAFAFAAAAYNLMRLPKPEEVTP